MSDVDLVEGDREPLEIEFLIQRMEQGGRWRESRVLCAEYLLPSIPEAERLARLDRDGLGISRAAYYIYLKAALAYLSGALSGGVTNIEIPVASRRDLTRIP